MRFTVKPASTFRPTTYASSFIRTEGWTGFPGESARAALTTRAGAFPYRMNNTKAFIL